MDVRYFCIGGVEASNYDESQSSGIWGRLVWRGATVIESIILINGKIFISIWNAMMMFVTHQERIYDFEELSGKAFCLMSSGSSDPHQSSPDNVLVHRQRPSICNCS